MLTARGRLSLAKTLLVAAWADGRLKQAELNHVKRLAQRFGFDNGEWRQLEPLIEGPPTAAERDALLEELASAITLPSDRQEAVAQLEGILAADDQITPEEHDVLSQYADMLKRASSLDSLAGRVMRLFRKQPAPPAIDLDAFIENKILFKLRRRVQLGPLTPDVERLCILGGLMGIVARADGDIDVREIEEIRRQLEDSGAFDTEAVNVLTAVIEEESVRGLDRPRLVSMYVRDLGVDERVELLDVLFRVAAASGSLVYAELEELRGIASAMGLSHREYIAAKLRRVRDSGVA